MHVSLGTPVWQMNKQANWNPFNGGAVKLIFNNDGEQV